jgi:hypothetical protein
VVGVERRDSGMNRHVLILSWADSSTGMQVSDSHPVSSRFGGKMEGFAAQRWRSR